MGTWALGNRTGFELGLVAEMAVQSLEDLDRDLAMLRLALRLKTGAGSPCDPLSRPSGSW